MLEIKEFVNTYKNYYKQFIANFEESIKIAIMQVGHIPASDRYVRNKIKDCESVGIACMLINLGDEPTTEYVIDVVKQLNDDESITGYILQLPIPDSLDLKKIKSYFNPEKDIDGFCENAYVYPATPVGIMSYLKGCSYQFEGKNAVVIGRSDIVGKPMAKMLLDANCTVTICHSKTKNLKQYTKLADLVIVATGHRNTIVPGMTKKNAVIIDVGINFDEEGKMCGDVSKELVQGTDYEFLSPVPGGVGLLTRLAVIINTLSLFLLK